MDETALWIIFAVISISLLFINFFIQDRRPNSFTQKRAVINVLIYIAIASAFGILVTAVLGVHKGASYFAAYIIEFAMSVDNLFLFIIIFSLFGIRDEDEHRVLYYGILGAVIFRAVFVFVGAELLDNFDWMLIIFGIIILYAAWKTAFGSKNKPAEKTFAYRLAKRIRSAEGPSEGKFFVKVDGKTVATTMFVCLVVIELSDVMFAFDSIPAALSITTDKFIVFSSNIFAVMGLRSLFFVIKNAFYSIKYLNYGLGAILGFIGVKMIASFFGYEVPVFISLLIIVIILGITVATSHLSKEDTIDKTS